MPPSSESIKKECEYRLKVLLEKRKKYHKIKKHKIKIKK